VAVSEAAVIATGGDPDAQYSLMVSLNNAGEADRARAVYAAIVDNCQDEETVIKAKKYHERFLADR
jgi:hypothetical protein